MKIAVLSDTHNLLRPEVIHIIRDSDAVIHGRDINSHGVSDEIKSVMKPNAQLFVVRGNNDKELAKNLPVSFDFELCGLKFFFTHSRKNIPQDIKADIIIFGNSHKYYEENIGDQFWLNPRNCGRKRFNLSITIAGC